MVIGEICSPTAFVRWSTSIDYCKTSDFFLWLLILVRSPPSLTTTRFLHFSSMNISLGESSKLPMLYMSVPSKPSLRFYFFSEGLYSSMKARVF